MTKFEEARLKYKPKDIRYLWVAEAPPKLSSQRFFYFEKVDEQDSLFLETMKCLYPEETLNVPTQRIRQDKRYFLEKFRGDGFYLIDALDDPFEEKLSSKEKEMELRKGQKVLLKKIQNLTSAQTKVILISAPNFNANYKFLLQNGIKVVNTEMIDFPGSGGQQNFQQKMKKYLAKEA